MQAILPKLFVTGMDLKIVPYKSFHIAPGHEPYHVRVYHRFCKSLTEFGYHVELIAQKRSSFKWAPNSDVVMHFLPEDYVVTYRVNILTRLKRINECYRLALKSNADVFTFHSPEFIRQAIRLRRKTGKPVVFDCMEDFESYARMREGIPHWLRPLLFLLVRRQLKRVARNVDAIITADTGTEEYFRSFNGRAKLMTLYNFPDTDLFKPPAEPVKKEYDLIYHGSFDRFLLQPILAIDDELTSRGRKLAWRLFGKCAVLDWLHGELNKRGAIDRFTISESIPLEEVPREVCKARIGIVPLADIPKYRSNIPQKIFEFMALGIPFVVSNLPPVQAFVKNETCCLAAKPGLAETYAEAILRLLDNPDLYQSMLESGIALAREQYNFGFEKHKLLSLYSDLLAQSRSQRIE